MNTQSKRLVATGAALFLSLSGCRSGLPGPGGGGGEGGENGSAGEGNEASGGGRPIGEAGSAATGARSGGGGAAATSGGTSASGGSAGEANADNCVELSVCDLVECTPPEQGGSHVATCSEISPSTNPPTSGPHYGVWAQFGIYDEPFLDGFLLHSLEHSAVALLYDCDAASAVGLDCEALRADLVEFYDAWPQDPLCSIVPHRLIVAPRPGLGSPFAVTAWGAYLKGSCFDEDLVRQFVQKNYGSNYENFCSPGVDPFDQGCAAE
jgi:Protein of unknown function (DUF3105)